MKAMHMPHRAPTAGQLSAEHPNVVRLARLGWLAKGVVYVVAGVLAASIAARAAGWSDDPSAGSQEASPTGAVKSVAGATGGTLLLWLLAIGMALYALWRLVSAVLPGGTDAKAIAKRVGYVVSAALYGTLAVTAIRVAGEGAGQEDGNRDVSAASRGIMEHTGGRLLVGLVGAIVIAVGLYRIGKGVKGDVDDELDLAGMSAERRRWTERLGALGEIGRGVGFGIIGVFLVRAALDYDAQEATGLDGALRRVAVETWGQVLVALVALGFLAHGVFCITTFTRRRLQAP